MSTLVESDFDLIVELAGCTLAKKAGKNNWVEEEAVGGLPEYICRIARAVHRDGSHSISQSIAIAVGRVKAWARGQGGVTAKTRIQAAKAVAEWERKKAAAKLDNKKAKLSNVQNREITLFFANSFSLNEVRRQYGGESPALAGEKGPWRYVREVWSDYLIVTVEDGNGNAKLVKVPFTVDKNGKATFGDEVEVTQRYVEVKLTSELQTHLTDEQLERAALIPCTEKDRGGLAEMVALASQQAKLEDDMIVLSNDSVAKRVKAILGITD